MKVTLLKHKITYVYDHKFELIQIRRYEFTHHLFSGIEYTHPNCLFENVLKPSVEKENRRW